MLQFREFMNVQAPAAARPAYKLWRMEKPDIMQHWQTLRPNTPIQFDPIDDQKKGSTFGEDGIRLTGSRAFIDSILGRLKDVMGYETPHTNLNVVYRQTAPKNINVPDNTHNFVFYAHVRERNKNGTQSPQVPQPGTSGLPNVPHPGHTGPGVAAAG